MQYLPPAMEKLVEQFARLPGIGGKTAQRLAFHVLSLPEEEAQAFADAIVTAKKTVTYCPVLEPRAPRGWPSMCWACPGIRPPSFPRPFWMPRIGCIPVRSVRI